MIPLTIKYRGHGRGIIETLVINLSQDTRISTQSFTNLPEVYLFAVLLTKCILSLVKMDVLHLKIF